MSTLLVFCTNNFLRFIVVVLSAQLKIEDYPAFLKSHRQDCRSHLSNGHQFLDSIIGFVQYLAPTIVFILGLTVFEQELQPVQLASFVLIWIAIAIFVSDLLARRKAS